MGPAIGPLLVQFAISVALSIAVSFVLSALRPKPKGAKRSGVPSIVRNPVEPQRVVYGRARVGGALVFASTTGQDNDFIHLVIASAVGPIQAFDTIHFGEESIAASSLASDGAVGSGRYAGKAWIHLKTGAANQTAIAAAVSDIPEWTNNHRLRGTAYSYIKLQFDPDIYPTGVPEITFTVRGRKVWDPRTSPSDPSVVAYSNNPALCALDYLMADFGFGAEFEEVDLPYWIAAANTSDEIVTTADARSIKRYTANGSFSLDQAPVEAMDDLVSAMAGVMTVQGGLFRGFAGAATVATATLDEGDLRGEIEVDTGPSRTDRFNTVKGTYIDPVSLVQTSFPQVSAAAYVTADNGEELAEEIELRFTSDTHTAQRIARLVLDGHRQGIQVRFPAKLTALDIAVWDVVSVTIAQLGWSAKEFRVLGWSLNSQAGIDLVLQEEASAIYTFDIDEEVLVDPAPDTTLPSAFQVPQPGVPTVTESLYETRDGPGVRARVTVSWMLASAAFVRDFQVEYKLSGATSWTIAGRTQAQTFDINDLAPGRYDFRVKAINTMGVSSPYATITNRSIFGLAAAPADITGLTIAALGGSAILRWDRHPDLDVRIGGRIEFRHSPVQVNAAWGSSVSIGNAVTGDQTVAVLPLKPGTYLAKAVDSTGQKSESATQIPTRAAQVLAFANVDTATEHPTFSGIHDGTVAVGGLLRLDRGGTVDDIGGSTTLQGFTDTFDEVENLDRLGGTLTEGTYYFAAGIDVGSVMRLRLRSVVASQIILSDEEFDSRVEPMDEWEDFDGILAGSPDGDSAGAEGDCQVWYRSTLDDPNGSPVVDWSEWNRLDAAEDEARAFEFRADIMTMDAAFNIQVSQLSVAVDEVV